MKTKDYLKTLTSDELEMHKEIIEETIQREKELDDMNIEDNIKKTVIELENILLQIKLLKSTVEKTNKELESHKLNTIPEDKFYKC